LAPDPAADGGETGRRERCGIHDDHILITPDKEACQAGRHDYYSYEYALTTNPAKAPIYTMGCPDPRAYSRNKRGIAGSLIWINFDRHALLDLFYKARGLFVADQDEIRPQFQDPETADPTALFSSSVVRDAGPYIGSTIDALDGSPFSRQWRKFIRSNTTIFTSPPASV